MRDKSKKLTVVNTGSDRFKGYSSKDAQRMVSGTRNVSGIWEQEGAGGSSDYLSAINDDEASGIISFLKGLILDGVLLDETLREDDERLPTDHNIMTSSRVLKELTKLDTRYLRKDKDDRSKGKISSNKGFEVGQFVSGASGASLHMEKESGRTVAELDKLYVRVKAIFETLEIVNVNSVGGKQIISPAGAMKCLGVQDKVYLFNEEGEPMLDSEGNQQYEELDFYRCYFLAEQDGEKIENRFKPGDQVYCKLFNAFTGVGNKIRSKWYWRLVENVNKNEDAVEYDGKLCHYIDLSKTICDVDSDIPEAGDIICHRGSLNDVDRQNFLEFSSVDSFSPSITLYQGVGGIYDRSKGEWVADYSLIGKDMVQFGVNTSTGKAFMNVYGDMYVGERSTIDEDGNMIEPKSYLRFVQGQGLEVKGKISVNSTIGDSEEETLGKFITDVHNDIQNLQNQVDGAIESFFYDYVPTLENYPASEWIETGTEELHLNDTFTHTEDGRSWRWVKDKHGVYGWAEISDTQSAEALRLAALAKDTADGKRRVFITTADNPHPNPPYDPGDLWTRGSEYPLLVCVVQKQAGQYYEQIDWALADNTEKVKEELDVAIKENAKNLQELNKSLSDTKDYIDGAFSDGIITESEKIAIGKYINQIETVKEQADESYGQVYNNELLLDKANDGSFADSTAKINLKNAYDVLSTSIYDLIEKINSVIEDDEATSDEIADVDFKYELFNQKYGDYIRCLNAAINYIELKINSKVEQNIIELGGYSYLKEALKDGARTEINGGLVQSTLLALGEYSDDGNSFKVWAGTSGIYDERKIGNGIASWYGGGNIDRFDYYDYTNNVFNVPSGIRAAAGVDRMDGTGYRANGNLWWDKDGVVHADPLSFFIGEATVGGLLASFQVVMKSDNRLPDYLIPKVPFQSLHVTNLFKIGSGSDSVELKYDSSNNALYIQKSDGSPVNFYSTGGISMYGQGDTSVKTIMDAIVNNLDRNTLDVQNGLITVVGGGGIESITKQMVIDALEYTPYDASNPNGYITSASIPSALPNPHGLTFGDKTYDGNEAKTISASDLGALTSESNLDWGKVINKPTTISGYGITDAYTKTQVDNALDGYLPSSGGSIDSTIFYGLTINSLDSSTNRSAIVFLYNNSNKSQFGWDGSNGWGTYMYNYPSYSYLGIKDDGTPFFNKNTILHSGNIGSYNAGSATKLQTARTIWGKNFDGTGDVDGTIKINAKEDIFEAIAIHNDWYTTDSVKYTDIRLLSQSTGKRGGVIRVGTGDYGHFNSMSFGFINGVDNYTPYIFINSSGNVGIGTTSTAYKLDVVGTAKAKSFMSGNIRIECDNNGVLGQRGSEINNYNSHLCLNYDSSTNVIIANGGGNVGIGTASPSKKLHVYGGATPIMCESNTSESSIYFVCAGTDSAYKWAIGKGVWGIGKKFGIGEYNTVGNLFVQINTNGYVGIGVPYNNSPSERLHVNGNILSTGTITTNDSLTINGINIRKSQDGVLYLDGNLVVKGGITMYGTDATNTPSILDSLPIASTSAKGIAQFSGDYFTVSDGIVRIIDGSVGLKESELNAILDGKNYATKTDLGNYLTLDANAASATKLSDNTSFTIWGQTFFENGKPNNVSGDMTLGFNCIYVRATDLWSDGTNSHPWYGIDYRYVNTGVNSLTISNYFGMTFKTHLGNISLAQNGNVGIGTTSPSSKLHVYGDVKAENGNFIGNLTGTASYATTAGDAEKFAGVDIATFISIIPTNTSQLENDAGFITSSGYSAGVTDYYDKTSNISIGYQSSSLTASQIDFIAAYSEVSGGDIVIKDVDKPTMQSWLGLGSLAYKSSLVASDIPSLDWSKITSGKPTTISGYGITDAITTSNIGSQSVNYATSSGSCTGNAASATKLSDNTSYTAWGQTFFTNGKPLSVSGDLSGVRNVISSGAFIGRNSSKANESYFGNASSGVNGDGALMYAYGGRNLYFYTNGVERIRVDSSGNVGVGTSNPKKKVDVTGDIALTGYLYMSDSSNTYLPAIDKSGNTLLFGYGQTVAKYDVRYLGYNIQLYAGGGHATGKGIDILANGNVGICTANPSEKLHVNGNILTTGGITMYSARILKNIVDERGLSLDELSAIKPTRYTWKDGRDNNIHFGGIADDIQQVLPEVVYKTSEGVLTMDYGNAGFAIAASLIKPVVDHEEKIRQLQKRVSELKQELNRLRA